MSESEKETVHGYPTDVCGVSSIRRRELVSCLRRVDDTLHFDAESVHIRQVVKFTGYKRAGAGEAASKH